MSQATISNKQEEWLKVLGKGMITLPKKWRGEMGVETGDVIKAKKEGNKIIIETRESKAPYRLFSDAEIDEFIKEDNLPKTLSKKIKANLASLSKP